MARSDQDSFVDDSVTIDDDETMVAGGSRRIDVDDNSSTIIRSKNTARNPINNKPGVVGIVS
jgi:hypothetical protein